MWEVDLVPEEHVSLGGMSTTDLDNVDDNFFDDFVIVEKVDMKKRNVEDKLRKEEKIKDSGQSKLVAVFD